MTIAAQDPISKIPEFKVCAVRVLRRTARPRTMESPSRNNEEEALGICANAHCLMPNAHCLMPIA